MPGAEAFRQLIGGCTGDADLIERQAKRVRADLREHRLMALTGARRSDIDVERAVRCETDARVLLRTADAALDEAGEPDAVVPAVDVVALQGLLVAPADLLQGALESDMEVAGIVLRGPFVGDERSDVVGHLRRGHEIAAPQFRRIDAQVGRGHVEQALAKEIRFDPAGSAIGAGGRLVADVDVHVAGEVRDAVRARQELRAAGRGRSAGAARVGADVDDDVGTQPQDRAVAIACDLQVAADLARVVGRHQVLAAILDPLDRAVERPGHERERGSPPDRTRRARRSRRPRRALSGRPSSPAGRASPRAECD